MSTVTLTAYNVKTKEKNVPIQDAVITKTAKGAYMAQGHDGKGNKLTTLLGEEKALTAIKEGIAKQGWQIADPKQPHIQKVARPGTARGVLCEVGIFFKPRGERL